MQIDYKQLKTSIRIQLFYGKRYAKSVIQILLNRGGSSFFRRGGVLQRWCGAFSRVAASRFHLLIEPPYVMVDILAS